jgi:hypothetical protein
MVEMRPVQLGRLVDELRVVREGLEASDVIVVSGLQRVRVGAAVNPVEEGVQSAARPEETR